MTSNQEALQKIFDAALKQRDPVEPTPASPRGAQKKSSESMEKTYYAETALPPRRPIKPACTEVVIPTAPTKAERKARKNQSKAAPVLDDAASDELAGILDEKMTRDNRKRKRQALVTLLVILGALGGTAGWFVQSPERVQALNSAIKEVRSVTDIKAIVANYQNSLNKVATRSQQVDQATAAMGMITELAEGEDAYMEDEMQSLMGGEGKTTGARAKALNNTFGDSANDAGGIIKPNENVSEEDSFSLPN